MRKAHRPLFLLNEERLICAQSMSRRLDGSSPTTRNTSPSTSSLPFHPPRANAVDGTRTLLVMSYPLQMIEPKSPELYRVQTLHQTRSHHYAGPQFLALGPAPARGLGHDVTGGEAAVGHPVPAPGDRINAPVARGHANLRPPGD